MMIRCFVVEEGIFVGFLLGVVCFVVIEIVKCFFFDYIVVCMIVDMGEWYLLIDLWLFV